MVKARLHHAHFLRAYKQKKIAENYTLLYNKHQKYWLKKLLKEAGEFKIKQKNLEEKRIIIREQDHLLTLIDNKHSPDAN